MLKPASMAPIISGLEFRSRFTHKGKVTAKKGNRPAFVNATTRAIILSARVRKTARKPSYILKCQEDRYWGHADREGHEADSPFGVDI